VKRRRRGTGGSRDHGEVLPAFPGGDDVHDGVLRRCAKMVMRSECLDASYNEGEVRLEIRP
jgi:hypothetical protein